MPEHSWDDDTVEATAAAWLAQREEGLDVVQAAEFASWCAADDRHAAAVARLEKVRAVLEKMPRLRDEARLLRMLEHAPVRRPPLVLRPVFRTVATLAAAAAVAAGGWWHWQSERTEVLAFATGADGFKRTVLSDGSVVELNALSAVTVRFTATERRLDLTSGEAHFNVAKNPARPFVVAAGHVQVRAVGTAFNVRLDARKVEVLVTEGRVAVASGPQVASLGAAGTPTAGGPTASFPEQPSFESQLAAGQRARVAADGPPAAAEIDDVEPAVVAQTLGWRVPRLVFAGEPLAEVVDRFNRRNRVQLVIGDAALSGRPVGGSFEADNVETFVRLLENTSEISIERPTPDRIVLRQAPASRQP